MTTETPRTLEEILRFALSPEEVREAYAAGLAASRASPEEGRLLDILRHAVHRNHAYAPGFCGGCSDAEAALRSTPAPTETRPGGTFPGDLDRMPSGHTRHCEARIRHGDGECECGIIEADGHIRECGNGSDDPEECSPFCAAAKRTVAEIRGDYIPDPDLTTPPAPPTEDEGARDCGDCATTHYGQGQESAMREAVALLDGDGNREGADLLRRTFAFLRAPALSKEGGRHG